MPPESGMETTMGSDANLMKETCAMSRPKILVTTAEYGARRYRRSRDLPGAVPGLLAKPEATILPELMAAEQKCEDERRARSAAYRPARHVQVLAALLAEASPPAPLVPTCGQEPL
ncbi:MAG: DUF6477 family protein [Pseudomonadota bacterium]